MATHVITYNNILLQAARKYLAERSKVNTALTTMAKQPNPAKPSTTDTHGEKAPPKVTLAGEMFHQFKCVYACTMTVVLPLCPNNSNQGHFRGFTNNCFCREKTYQMCCSHVLNLAISASCTSIPSICNLFDNVQKLTWFLAKRKEFFLETVTSRLGSQVESL